MGLDRSIRIVVALLGLGTTVFSVSGVAQAASDLKNIVHVAIRVFDSNGEPVGALTAKNFPLYVPGTGPELPTVTAPPVHLMVLLAAGQGNLSATGQASVRRALEPLWKAGWWISVRDADGRQTPYLANGSGLIAVPGLHASIAAAVGTLAEFPGRRVVFVVTGRHFNVDDATMRLAKKYHTMLYQVGAERSNRFQPGSSGGDFNFQEFGASGEIIAQATFPGFDFPPTPATPYLHQDTSLRAAVRHALEDGTGFYDLQAQVPVDVVTLALALRLQNAADSRYHVQAQPYAEGRGTLPTVTIKSESR